MTNKQTAITFALSLVAASSGLLAGADDGKIRLRVKVGDAAESQLTVVNGHRAELKSSNLDVALVPTVSHDEVMLSLTLTDSDNKIVGTPRLKGQFGKQMKLVLGAESASPVTVLLTPERLD